MHVHCGAWCERAEGVCGPGWADRDGAPNDPCPSLSVPLSLSLAASHAASVSACLPVCLSACIFLSLFCSPNFLLPLVLVGLRGTLCQSVFPGKGRTVFAGLVLAATRYGDRQHQLTLTTSLLRRVLTTPAQAGGQPLQRQHAQHTAVEHSRRRYAGSAAPHLPDRMRA